MLRAFMVAAMLTSLYPESFDEYVQRLKHDPSVQALHYRQQAQHAAADAAQSLPDPQLIIAADNVPVDDPAFDRYLPTSKTIGFKQAFPNGLDDTAASQHLRAEASALQAEYRHAELVASFIGALRQRSASQHAYHDVLQQKKLLKGIYDEALARLESSQTGYERLSRIDERLIDLDERLSQLKTKQSLAEHTLIRLVGAIPELEPPEATPKPYTLEQLYPIRIATLQRDSDAARQKAAQALDAPDLSVQLLYKQREEGEGFDGGDWVSLSVGIGLPIWGRTEAAYRNALHTTSASSAALERDKRQWQQTLQDLQSRYDETIERLRLHRSHLKISQERLEALSRAYETGTVSLDRMLETRISELNIRSLIAELEAQAATYAALHNSHIKE